MNNIETRNNFIFMEFEILGKRQKEIAKEHGLAEKTVKLIICEIRKDNLMTTGRPEKTDRNLSVITDFKFGMTAAHVAKKYELRIDHARKIYSEYLRKQKIAEDESKIKGLYYERDAQMKAFYKSLNTKGKLSKLHMHDIGVTKSGYRGKHE